MYICLHASLHGYFFITLQVHFYKTLERYVNKPIRHRTTEASKMQPFLAKGIRSSVELQDNGCFLFCSVQSIEECITKLCCAKRVEPKANGSYHRTTIQHLPNTNGSFILALDLSLPTRLAKAAFSLSKALSNVLIYHEFSPQSECIANGLILSRPSADFVWLLFCGRWLFLFLHDSKDTFSVFFLQHS